MSTRASIFNQNAFKEFFLPVSKNIDYQIKLQAAMFGMRQDTTVFFENVDGNWFLVDGEEKTALNHSCLYHINCADGSQVSMFIQNNESSCASYEKFDLTYVETITFGQSTDCSVIYSFEEQEGVESLGRFISHLHVVITRQNQQFVLENRSVNGVFVESRLIRDAVYPLQYGDTINIFGMRAIFLGDVLAVDTSDSHVQVNEQYLPRLEREPEMIAVPRGEKKFFHRSPRSMPTYNTEPIEIEAPPGKQEQRRQPLFLTIGPSLTMSFPMLIGTLFSILGSRSSGGRGGIFMFTGIFTAMSSALIGMMWTLINIRQAKKLEKEQELRRYEAYGQYLIDCSNSVQEKYTQNMEIMNSLYPSTEECLRYDEYSTRLWNRNNNHPDFLFQRLGVGNVPFQAPIKVPKERFTMKMDSLAEKPMRIYESFHMLIDVPVGVDLRKDKIIGITGNGNDEGMYSVLRNLVMQLVSNTCYTDVKLAFAIDGSKQNDESQWAFTKWLPHVWSEDKKARYCAFSKDDASDMFYELTNVFRRRMEEEKNKKGCPKPYYILFIDNPELLEGELISKYIFAGSEEGAKEIGLTTVFLAPRYEELPNSCTFVIENSDEFKGFYHVTDAEKDKTRVSFDYISSANLELFARRISDIEVNEVQVGGEIPGSLTFFDMYGVNTLQELNVIERWRKNRTYENMKALVGQKTGQQPCYLDVHEKYHGPHGLVAGTTGSGKSETLQTYILSLALNFSPNDVGFFLIDYKGGGMANLFNGLPHLIGQISNLSGNQVHRAMVSIKSENLRRQRVFNEHGVNNINLYTRLYKNGEASIPVPHLFIIIDEFAELKREEPDFMRELISVAQVGRSLGVHLILATQKPSGTVDDNIWSNSKFKLCLRVQDRQDSNDMLHKPDAAYITQAGRCYLQVGNDEIYELFQSGWSGATYDENAGATKTEMAKMVSHVGKAALVGSRAKKKRKELAKHQWIEKLVGFAEELDGNRIYKEEVDALAGKLMKKLEEQQIDYDNSEYNMKRLANLIALISEVQEKSADAGIELSLTQKADSVIGLADARNVKLPEAKEKTQLDAVVEYLGEVAAENGYHYDLKLWLPVLPTKLLLEKLDGYTDNAFENGGWKKNDEQWNLEAIVGLCDDPEHQMQMPLVLDFAQNGHHVVCGSVASGKSTFLQTVLYSLVNRYTPEELNIYALDFSSRMLSPFERLAHVGGVLYETDLDTIGKLFHMIGRMIEERKALLKGGNYAQYVLVHGVTLPAVVIAIDNYANFKEKTGNAYESMMMQLAKEGIGYGIYLLVSASGFGINELPSKIADNFKTTISLEMSDKYGYGDILRTMKISVMPEAGIKGRGLVMVNGNPLEFQTAISLDADDDYQRIERIENQCAKLNEAWKGRRAKQVPVIPEKPTMELFLERDEVQTLAADRRFLPLGYNAVSADITRVDLAHTFAYLITGKGRTGKTNTLKVLMKSAAMKIAALGTGQAILLDTDAGDMKRYTEELGFKYTDNDKGVFDFFSTMIPVIKERSAKRKEWQQDGYDEEQIFEKMKEYESYYIFISDLTDFVKHIYNPAEGVGNMSGFMEVLTGKGAMLNIYFFSTFNLDTYSEVLGKKVFEYMASSKWGVHMGGSIVSHRIFNYDDCGIPFSEQNKSLKPGIGLIPTNESADRTVKVIIPSAGK